MFLSANGLAADKEVDGYVNASLRRQHVPGAAIAVIKEGKVVEEITFGNANLQLNVPVTRMTVFQLASVTKVFTAAALMLLEKDGKLRMDDAVSKYLPGLPLSWSNVTLREMASHTSGLPDVIEDPNKPLSDDELRRSTGEALKFASSHPVAGLPGARFQYDQTNYVLLKEVVERISGQDFRSFVSSRILGAEMPHTLWGDGRAIVRGRADMYTELHENRLENGSNLYQYPDYLESAAGLNSNIVDMEAFGAKLTTGSLLTPAEFADMWKPATNRAGTPIDLSKDMEITGQVGPASGWFYADNSHGQYPRVFMTGGSATSIVVFPKQQLCIVVLTNLQAKDDPLPIAEGIAKFYLPGLKPMF